MARKPSADDRDRPWRAWSVNGSSPVGAMMLWGGEKFIVFNWDPRRRALTLLNESCSVTLINPLCMQWEK